MRQHLLSCIFCRLLWIGVGKWSHQHSTPSHHTSQPTFHHQIISHILRGLFLNFFLQLFIFQIEACRGQTDGHQTDDGQQCLMASLWAGHHFQWKYSLVDLWIKSSVVDASRLLQSICKSVSLGLVTISSVIIFYNPIINKWRDEYCQSVTVQRSQPIRTCFPVCRRHLAGISSSCSAVQPFHLHTQDYTDVIL